AQQYFTESHTTCILRHSSFDVQLEAFPVLNIAPDNFDFDKDIYDYKARRFELELNGIYFNDWILKLTVAIEQSNCESFIVFQEHIPMFAHYFYNASIYSIWRSVRNRFIFAYTDELTIQSSDVENYVSGYIFHDQANILLVHAQFLNSSVFDIKTNRFVGEGRYFGTLPKPAEMVLLQRFDAKVGRIIWNSGSVMKNKLKNLQGREVVLCLFNYKPFMLLDYERKPTLYDRALNDSKAFAEGTEVRIMLEFCEKHNCTIQVDTTEKSEWGNIYSNVTGYGLMGMILDRRNDYGMGGLFIWLDAYRYMEMTTYVGRSGITCLVPAPHRVISWTLPMRPFQASLWLCVVSYLLLECIALAAARRWERNPTNCPRNSLQKSLQFGFVSVMKLFVNQSTKYATFSYALRTLLMANYIVDIILTTVYGGGLAAILTLPTLEEAADSRQRLYEHQLLWTGTSPAWISSVVDAQEEPVLQGIVEHYRVYDAEEIATMSRTKQMGFVAERMQFGHLGNVDILPEDALPRLKLMVDDLFFVFSVAYVPRLWPYLEDHTAFVLDWHSYGFDKYWEWKIAADYMNVRRQNRVAASQRPSLDIGPVELGIDNFIGLILIWCFGMICSLIAFLIEVCFQLG
ncbi:Ir76a, partial [Drosophila busckii]